MAQLAVGALSRGVLKPEREADHSSSSVEVKNTWRYAYTPAICLHIAHRGNVLQSKPKFGFISCSLLFLRAPNFNSVVWVCANWAHRLDFVNPSLPPTP